jgi:Cdc6-like AAA superfamily ATPase
MDINNIPPSQPYQRWDSMAVFTLLLAVPGSLAAIYYFWSIHAAWGPIDKHLKIFGLIFKEWFIDEQMTWELYSEFLRNNHWMDDFIAHLTIPTLVVLSLALFLSGTLLYVPGGRTLDRHKLGVRKYVGKAAYRHASQQLVQDIKQGGKPGISLHPKIEITSSAEEGNILVTGKPGSGKTVIISYLLSQLLQRRGIRLFIFDEKREYTGKLYQKKNSILIAPWDKRGSVWNIAKDMSHTAAPANFAAHIIYDTRDMIWCQAARLIFTGIIVALKQRNQPWGWVQIQKIMNLDDDKLRNMLEQNYPQAMRYVEKNNRTTQSILATLLSDLAWIEWLALAWPKSYLGQFSICDWVQNNEAKPRLIVQGHRRFSVIGIPLCNALMSIMCDEYLSMDKQRECYLVLDELANLPKSPSLLRWIELSRSQLGRTIAGTQSVSQLKSLYGDNETDSLTSMFSNLITLKVGSTGGTAEYMSKSLGERVIERPHRTSDSQGRVSTTWHEHILPTVHTSELTQLPTPGKKGIPGFLSVNGWGGSYEITWPYPHFPTIGKREMLAKWTQASSSFPEDKPCPSIGGGVKLEAITPERIANRREGVEHVNY